MRLSWARDEGRLNSTHFSERGYLGRLTRGLTRIAKPQQRSRPAPGRPRRKGSIGRLEPGHGRIKPQWAEKQDKARPSSIPTSRGCACRGGADAPFEPKAVYGEFAVFSEQRRIA